MSETTKEHIPTDAEKRAVARLKAPQPSMTYWRAVRAAEEREREEKEIHAGTANNGSIGYQMSDGTIYAGISPDTNKPMFTTPADAKLTMTFNRAAKYAKNLKAHGYKDWRVPTKDELNLLFENREDGALKGTFNLIDSATYPHPASWYFSGNYDAHYSVYSRNFRNGAYATTASDGDYVSSVRCVRG